jgi:hypothetical protein
MFNDPDVHRQMARQRERELIEDANRERLAKVARERGGSGDTKRRGGR